MIETVFTNQSEVFMDLSTLVDKLMEKDSKKKTNILLYLFILLFEYIDGESSQTEMDMVSCRSYISDRLNKLKIAYDPSFIDIFLSHYNTELSPVSAIMGAVVAQESLKILSAKELPIQSFFIYNAIDQSNSIESLQ